MSRFWVTLGFSAGELMLDITHGLLELPAFFDLLKKGMPPTLPLLIDLRGKRFVLWMLCRVGKCTLKALPSLEEGANGRIIVHRCRLFGRESSWLAAVDGTAHRTGRPHERRLGLDTPYNSLCVNGNAS